MIEENALGLLFEAAWKSLLVAGAALLLLALLRRRSAAERACLAHFGMAAVLLVPVLVVAGPSLEVELLTPAPAEIAAAPVAGSGALFDESAAAPLLGEAAPAMEAVAMNDGLNPALLLYLLPAGLLLLMILVAVGRLFMLRGRASVIVEQGWLTALAHAQRRMGIKHGTALLASRELHSPVSWGVLRPIILLSEDALDKPVDAEAIIAHELAHVARADWLNLLIARVTTAIFWFNPLVWLLARQGHQLREEAADDAVLRANVPSTEYAALLVGHARHEGRSLLLAANGVAPGKNSLSQRVRRILEPTLPRSPARFAWGSSCAAGALLIAGPLAALTPAAPPAPELPLPALAAAAPIARPAPFAPAAAPAPLTPSAPAVAPAPPAPAAPAPAQAPAVAAATAVAAAPAAPPAASAPAPAPAPRAIPATPAVASPPIPPDALVSMRAHGVTAATHAEYAAAYPRLRKVSADQLVNLKIHNVTPQKLRQYAALGYGDLDCSRLIEWAVHGVTPGYIQSIAAEGYRGLAPAKLTQFRIMGVSPRFIQEVREAGLGGLSAERLVELRVHGVQSERKPRTRVRSPGGPSPGPHPRV
jgi:bla regulator protein blaR1